MMPSEIPKGFPFPPVADADNTIGRSGQIQGAAIVTSPERNAKRRRIIITFNYTSRKIS